MTVPERNDVTIRGLPDGRPMVFGCSQDDLATDAVGHYPSLSAPEESSRAIAASV